MSTTAVSSESAAGVHDNDPKQEFVQAALNYADQGQAVLPLVPNDKTPLTPSGFKDATTDKDIITRLWDLTCSANIGIATGEASGLLVLDVDVKNGTDGRSTLQGLIGQLGPLPSDTLVVTTPNGGLHIYFGFPDELKGVPLKNALGVGIEIKGNGRYVVAPPSVVDGILYKAATDVPPATLPDSWVEACIQPLDWERYQTKLDGKTICQQHGIRMVDVIDIPRNAGRTRAGYLFKNPIHGATGTGNLFVNPSLDLWYCFRCGSGGDPLTWVAVREGFICCDEAKALDKEVVKKCVEVLKAEGLIPEDTMPKAEVTTINGQGKEEAFEVTLRKLDDIGNVERFTSRHGENLRYVTELGRWYLYNGKYWTEVTNERVRQLAFEIPAVVRHEAALIDKLGGMSKDEKERLARTYEQWAHTSSFKIRLDAVVDLAKSDLGISAHTFNQHPFLFNVANGTFNYETGELQPFSREDYITQYCPVEYDPTIEPTKWLKFLSKVQPDHEIQDFLQRAAGYSTTGVVTEEALLFLHGRDATGKSTTVDSIQGVIGTGYAQSAKFNTFLASKEQGGSPREDIARLKDVRMVVCSEVNRKTTWNSALLKLLVSGEKYVARLPHSPRSVEFSPVFKLWFSANDKPHCDYDDSAVFRRFYVVPFGIHIPVAERDRNLRRFFNTDPQAQKEVLAWVIAGGLEWYKRSNGGHNDGLQAPELVRQATKEYELAMNPLFDFIKNECVVGCDKDGKPYECEATDLWNAFSTQIGKGYDTRRVRSAVSMGKKLTDFGFEAFHSTTRKRRGLMLLDKWSMTAHVDDTIAGCPFNRTGGQVMTTLEEKSLHEVQKYDFCSICWLTRPPVLSDEDEETPYSERIYPQEFTQKDRIGEKYPGQYDQVGTMGAILYNVLDDLRAAVTINAIETDRLLAKIRERVSMRTAKQLGTDYEDMLGLFDRLYETNAIYKARITELTSHNNETN